MLESDYNGYKVRLVENEDDLRYLAHVIGKNPKIMVGVDSETESLEYKPECVAGWCLAAGKSYSKQDYAGYYLPIRHYDYDNNLPVNKVNELVSLCLWKRKTCFWNRNFDVSMAEMDGIKIPFIGHMNDGQVMAHLAFSESYPALKPTVEKLLKFDVLEFSSNNAKDHNFKTTNPRVSYRYACFSDDTKFMTKTGWKTYDEISDGEEIVQWSPDTDELEFVVPISRHDYTDAETLEFKNGAVSCCVTPNHRVYGRSNIRRSWQVRYAEDWKNKTFQVKTQTKGYKGVELSSFFFKESTTYGGKLNTSVVHHNNALELAAVPFMKLLGFLLGDGNVCKNNSSWAVRFVQSSGVEKQKHVEWLDKLNSELGGIFKKVLEPLKDGKKHRMWVWSCYHKNLGSWLRENLYNADKTKKVPNCVFTASVEQRKAFLEGLRMADGSERKGGNNYHIDVCSNKNLAEQVLYVVNSVGLTAKMSCNFNKAGTTTFGKEDYICYRILINPHLETRTIDKRSWAETGKKRVVCFSVPSTYLLVQRDYTTYISGNSQDPLVTTLVTMKLWNDYPYIRKIYPLDNMTLEAVRLMSKQEVYLDFPLLKRMLAVEQKKLAEIKAQIYAIAGYQFNLNSNADKSDALSRFVTLTKKGKSGKFLVDKETLAQIDHPLAKLLVEYNEQRVYLSSFLEKMCNYDDGKPVRFSTDSTNVVTGRLSSGGKKGNSYYRPQNIQNVPKVQVEGRVFLDSDIGVAIKDHPDNYWSTDSKIKLKDSVKALSEVKVGDKLNDDVDVDYISKVQSDGVEIQLDNGKIIKLGNNQFIPIMREGKQTFVMVQDLKETDEILLNE